ncbi:MAG TPA: LysE family transporter [Propionibacteriaceae bacterium]|nr:LysE family transporter [Propionibacteriaceae bacterium]
MLDLVVLAKAFVVGLSVAAPVGPIALLTIQRAIQRGFRMGLATGLGAAVADALYGTVGAVGVTWLVSALTSARVPLAVAGAAVLLVLAWRTWRAPLAGPSAQVGARGLVGAFGGTVLLTLANPATILSFIAVFGVLAASGTGPVSPLTMVVGVFLGSATWWLFLAGVVSATRSRFDDAWRRRVNAGSALVLALFAVSQVALAVRSVL